MWEKVVKGDQDWYECFINKEVRIIQGTKSYNPLEYLPENKCGLRQIHSSVIHRASPDKKYAGDGLYTCKKRLVIYIKTADCLPIILYNRVKRVLGIIHAGWRGTLLGISRKFVTEMQSLLDISEWVVAMGPSIEPDCYEVGAEVYELFRNAGIDGVYRDSGNYYLNLQKANLSHIEESRITDLYEFPSGTVKNSSFFSHRKGDSGRNITAAMII